MAHGARYGRLLKHGMHDDLMNCKTVNAWVAMGDYCDGVVMLVSQP